MSVLTILYSGKRDEQESRHQQCKRWMWIVSVNGRTWRVEGTTHKDSGKEIHISLCARTHNPNGFIWVGLFNYYPFPLPTDEDGEERLLRSVIELGTRIVDGD